MKEKFNIKISQEEKDKALLKGLKKGGRESDLESGSGVFNIKGGPHKDKKKYRRHKKHKGKNEE